MNTQPHTLSERRRRRICTTAFQTLDMKLPLTCLLLLCLSVLAKENDDGFKVESSSGGARVICPTDYILYKNGKGEVENSMIKYKDSNTGEYYCEKKDGTDKIKLYAKFRSCDNCIELEPASIAGLIVGDVVATFVIGVSVYLLAKHAPGGTPTPNKKGSDKQRLVPNEVNNEGGYQPLKFKQGRGDVYDQLHR